MTDSARSVDVGELVARLRAIDGVVQVFPRHAVAEAIRPAAAEPPLVDLQPDGSHVKVGARIGIERSKPISTVIDHVSRTLPATLDDRPVRIDIEVAYIE